MSEQHDVYRYRVPVNQHVAGEFVGARHEAVDWAVAQAKQRGENNWVLEHRVDDQWIMVADSSTLNPGGEDF